MKTGISGRKLAQNGQNARNKIYQKFYSKIRNLPKNYQNLRKKNPKNLVKQRNILSKTGETLFDE